MCYPRAIQSTEHALARHPAQQVQQNSSKQLLLTHVRCDAYARSVLVHSQLVNGHRTRQLLDAIGGVAGCGWDGLLRHSYITCLQQAAGEEKVSG